MISDLLIQAQVWHLKVTTHVNFKCNFNYIGNIHQKELRKDNIV